MSKEIIGTNRVRLSGEVVSNPTLSHVLHEEEFYEFNLAVERLSEHRDVLPVVISNKVSGFETIAIGNKLSIKGQFRSYNKAENEKSKLILSVFCKELLEFNNAINPNEIYLSGFVCKAPIYRTTPFNREICDVLIAVNRGHNKSDYLPLIAWGRNARHASDFAVGDPIEIVGRIQSREYEKRIGDEIIKKVAYEISVNQIGGADLERGQTINIKKQKLYAENV
ncbi:MAG: single-stranded DNA-binding protein [Firmicutes bacterium]|nr:single-stranded DNA-binding protein [Bacillota bacterium]